MAHNMYSYTMSTHGFPDMYTRSPRAATTYISEYVHTNIYVYSVKLRLTTRLYYLKCTYVCNYSVKK